MMGRCGVASTTEARPTRPFIHFTEILGARDAPSPDYGEFPAGNCPLSFKSIQDDVRNEASILAGDQGPILPYTHTNRLAGDQPASDQRVISDKFR